MTSARERVVAFWDDHIRAWLAGEDAMPDPLRLWFGAFQGKGLGKVTREGLPEPYLGDLAGHTGTPRMVLLGLNPGQYQPEFQSRDGIFAQEINRGRYSSWAATGPYLRAPWTEKFKKNRYWGARLAFAQRWLDRPAATHNDILVFECYPWHSTKITAPMKPSREVIHRFVLEPIAEIPTTDVFAFGKPWNQIAQAMGLKLTDALGRGGTCYESRSPSRAVRVYALPPRQRLIIEWHAGGAGPPSEPETAILRKALTGAAT